MTYTLERVDELMLGKIGTSELILIMGICILIFGPKKIPQLGKAIGKTIGNFKRGSKEAQNSSGDIDDDEE